MKFEFNGETFRLGFRHEDFRFSEKVKDVSGQTHCIPNDRKVIRKNGQARTIATLEKMVKPATETEPAEWLVIDVAVARCSPKDSFNRGHGRWYATEMLIASLRRKHFAPDYSLNLLAANKAFHRAIRKAMYAGTSWRPDGRDGFKINRMYHSHPTLERVRA